MNQFIDRMDIKFLGANLAGVGTSERKRITILAIEIKSAHPILYALLRSLIIKPYKSIALAAHGRELLSDVPSDESEGEELATTKILAQRIITGHELLSIKDLNCHSRNLSPPNTNWTGKATSQRERYHRMHMGTITASD